MVASNKCGRQNSHRYKGIEGLLRRFAFNLGNSPSQTEVKIISCIPIDVTDLQEKIACLERQLEQLQGRVCQSQAIFPMTVNRTKFRVLYPQSNESANAQPNIISINPGSCPPVPDGRNNEHQTSAVPQGLPLRLTATQALVKPPRAQGTAPTETRHGKAMPEKNRTHLVYYAQMATGSPFTNCEKDNTNIKKKLEETIDRTYLTSIIQRQYKFGEMCEGLSQVSAPVCRDFVPQGETSEDMCSCCQGHFLDIDHTTHRQVPGQPVYVRTYIDRHNIYDPNVYDMKPVREKSIKINEITKKTASESDLTFFPEYYPFKPEYSLKTNCTKSVKFPKRKYHTQQIFLQNDSSQTDGCVEFSHVYTKRLSPKRKSRNAKCMVRIESTTGYMDTKLVQTLSFTKLIRTDLNKPGCKNHDSVDQTINNAKCDVRPAKALQTSSIWELRSTHSGLNKAKFTNAERIAIQMNETECQTDPLTGAQSESVSPPEPNKTKTTLDQIKSILQTVLTEVRTSSQMQAIEEGKETRDKIAQKDSLLSPDCERFLGSFTYSPFAMNNPYLQMASCSRYMPTYCSSMMRQTPTMPPRPSHLNCVQNFPVFVDRTLATQARCNDRTLMQLKETSTNTLQEPPKKRNPETENLLKEIYKSIALNVDFPIQTTPRAGLEEKTINKVSLSEFRTADAITQDREQIILRGDVGTFRRENSMMENHNSHSITSSRPQRPGCSFDQCPTIVTSAMRRQSYFTKPGDGPDPPAALVECATDAEDNVAQPSSTLPKVSQKGFFGKVMSSVLKRMRKKRERQPQRDKRRGAIACDSDSSGGDTVVSRRRKIVKHVSYAPVVATPQTRRLDHLSRTTLREQNRRSDTPLHSPPRQLPPHHSPPHLSPLHHSPLHLSPLHHSPLHLSPLHHSPLHLSPLHHSPPHLSPRQHSPLHPQMPRVVPRSALRPAPGRQPVRLAAHPSPPFPQSPHNGPRQQQFDTHPSSPTDDHIPKPRPRNKGLKLTNKCWMQKPVYHLGFVCGPEKKKIMMQH